MKTPMGDDDHGRHRRRGFMSMARPVQDLPGSQKKGMLDSIRDTPMWLGGRANDPAYTFAITGDAKVGEIDAKVLEISGDGIRVKWYVDPKTGHILFVR